MNNIYYVYAYLRKSDNTPYYIGKGSDHRAYSKNHTISVPKDKSKIVFLKTNLTELWAFAMERWYIRWYGRKDLNTGILHNKTDGGEGVSGMIPWNKGLTKHDDYRVLTIAEKNKNKKATSETLANMSAAQLGKIPWNKGLIGIKGTPCSDENKEYYRNLYKDKPRTEKDKQAIKDGWKIKHQSGYEVWNKGKTGVQVREGIPCVFISPEGQEFTYRTFKEGCVKHELARSAMSRIKNTSRTHKGWRVRTLA